MALTVSKIIHTTGTIVRRPEEEDGICDHMDDLLLARRRHTDNNLRITRPSVHSVEETGVRLERFSRLDSSWHNLRKGRPSESHSASCIAGRGLGGPITIYPIDIQAKKV